MQRLEKQQQFYWPLMWALSLSSIPILFAVLTNHLVLIVPMIIFLFAPPFIIWWLQKRKSANFLHNRSKVIANLAKQNAWQVGTHGEPKSAFSRSTLFTLFDLKPEEQPPLDAVQGEGWAYRTIAAVYHADNRSGLDLRDTAVTYYAAISLELPKVLPNIFFDSLSARSHQYKAVFNSEQKINLEGNFSEYFNTYFSKKHGIESLSFITPEVMEALIETNDYDIEIIGNRLLMYGPLLDAGTQLPEMLRKAMYIRKKIFDSKSSVDITKKYDAETVQKLSNLGVKLKGKSVNIIFVYVLMSVLLIASVIAVIHLVIEAFTILFG